MAIGTVSEPLPVTGLAPNFSPMPRMAPPPFGSVTFGATIPKAGPFAVDAPLKFDDLLSSTVSYRVEPRRYTVGTAATL